MYGPDAILLAAFSHLNAIMQSASMPGGAEHGDQVCDQG
jgi:hypothetical protein